MFYERAVELQSEQVIKVQKTRKHLVRLLMDVSTAKGHTRKLEVVSNKLEDTRKEFRNQLQTFAEADGLTVAQNERLIFDAARRRVIPAPPDHLVLESFVTGTEVGSIVTLGAFFGTSNAAAKKVKSTRAGTVTFNVMRNEYEQVLLMEIDRHGDTESIKRLRAYIGRFNSTFPQYVEYGLKSAKKR